MPLRARLRTIGRIRTPTKLVSPLTRDFVEECNLPSRPCGDGQTLFLDLMSAPVVVPLDVPVGMTWIVEAYTSTMGRSSTALSDFAHTIAFPTGADVFDLAGTLETFTRPSRNAKASANRGSITICIARSA